MKILSKIMISTLLVSLIFTSQVSAQQMLPLPIDKDVRYGILDNGLTYYVRHNELPKNRAEFYIAQKVGSILEEDDQRGLAHFLEHMAFNGTKNFPGKSMLNYLESIGVKFGTNVNAYTSFDETVYNLSNVPTIRQGIVDSCLLILHDWASQIALEDKEIDEERGVIREEWRTRTDANMRMWDILIPTMFEGSQYANRMPIGTMDVVMNFPYKTLRDYYHKWYRPDQQGIIVVGDINAEKVEAEIKKIFGAIPMPANAAERIYYTVPDNKEPIVVVGKDKEATSTGVMVFFKHEPIPKELKATIAGIAQAYIQAVANMMINARLSEIAQKPDAPFLRAYTYDGNFFVSKTKDAFTVEALSKEGESAKALKAVLVEIERANKYGFTPSEYDRAKASLLSMVEQVYNEKDKTRNSSYVEEYVNHFIDGGAIPGIETEYNLYKHLASEISLEDINKYIEKRITDDNIVVAITGPDKEGVDYPSESDVLEIIKNTHTENLTPYEDKTFDEPLISEEPVPGKIIKKQQEKDFGTTVWTLSNGAKVVIKPTDYKNDEILFNASSKGGSNLYPTKDIVNLDVFNSVIDLSKNGNFTNIDLKKMLAGKQVSVSLQLGDYSESVSGTSTPKDLETMLQLVYLSMTDINKDENAYMSWKQRMASALRNQEASPQKALRDTLNVAMWNNNPRAKNLTAEDLDKIDYDRILTIWKERFGDASDFTFTFVGNIDTAQLKPLVEKYIASLPSLHQKEKSGKPQMQIRKGKYVNDFKRQMETPKSTVYMIYSGNIKYSQEDAIKLSMFDQIMDIVYTATIREEEGGTYGVSTQSSMSRNQNNWIFMIAFDTNPEMQEKMQKRAVDELMKQVDNGPSEENFNKVKEYMLKQYNENLHDNGFWLGNIVNYKLTGKNEMKQYEEIIKKQSPETIKKLVKKLFSQGNYIQVTMDGVVK
ncbi:M16 family metallopeptidase [Coprobacter tertius]|uniref:Insulinase family protein n=1 Tax=Coprobacter tertius TaxID=2944915 RepID=A0ABT1MEL0_9BACT|nr:M16 family metallopeptidase [Coprobacter tertius]MCP9611065.1 insulinase family protein [Coprobacter tertius]